MSDQTPWDQEDQKTHSGRNGFPLQIIRLVVREIHAPLLCTLHHFKKLRFNHNVYSLNPVRAGTLFTSDRTQTFWRVTSSHFHLVGSIELAWGWKFEAVGLDWDGVGGGGTLHLHTPVETVHVTYDDYRKRTFSSLTQEKTLRTCPRLFL